MAFLSFLLVDAQSKSSIGLSKICWKMSPWPLGVISLQNLPRHLIRCQASASSSPELGTSKRCRKPRCHGWLRMWLCHLQATAAWGAQIYVEVLEDGQRSHLARGQVGQERFWWGECLCSFNTSITTCFLSSLFCDLSAISIALCRLWTQVFSPNVMLLYRTSFDVSQDFLSGQGLTIHWCANIAPSGKQFQPTHMPHWSHLQVSHIPSHEINQLLGRVVVVDFPSHGFVHHKPVTPWAWLDCKLVWRGWAQTCTPDCNNTQQHPTTQGYQ